RPDLLSFAGTSFVVLTVYLATLAPGVGLQSSGIFSVGAMYAGVPHPPGYPVWTIYGWLFTVLLPVSNIAWRLAVASAVAGSLACGFVAATVSRSGLLLAEGSSDGSGRANSTFHAVRAAAGFSAGAAVGFDGGLWRCAVVAGAWPLSILMFSVALFF